MSPPRPTRSKSLKGPSSNYLMQQQSLQSSQNPTPPMSPATSGASSTGSSSGMTRGPVDMQRHKSEDFKRPQQQQPRGPIFSSPANGILRANTTATYVPTAPRGSSHPSNIFNMAPKKVIRAVADYNAQYANELSFQAGDFFYVVGDSHDYYYEVVNPLLKTRGNVPRECFQNLDKTANGPNSAGTTSRNYNIDYQQQPDQYNYQNQQQQQQQYQQYQSQPDQYMEAPLQSPPMSPGNPNMISPTMRPQYQTQRPSTRTMTFVQHASVRSVELRQDKRYWYTVEAIRSDNKKTILFRTHDDFWALHVSLLTHFPEESGHSNTSPRTIPFIPSPQSSKSISMEMAELISLKLDLYLSELLHLPLRILQSSIVNRFFLVREQDNGDMETSMELEYESSNDLINLIDEYGGDDTVKIRVSLGRGGIAFRSNKNVNYEGLLQEIEGRLDIRIKSLAYMDETNGLITLFGDQDLRLLIKTNGDRLVFYPDY
ncbi:bud emergence protein 1 [Blyttiomyces sp. JEL0837]|nr:bud emergence protein 1 [Blyttiomyces sp. JEL0837]